MWLDPNNVEDPNVLASVAGYYEFQLEASDGQLSSSDTVQVYVGVNPCDTAQNDPAYVPFAADLNSDCFVKMEDLSEMAAEWLMCNSLVCP